MQDYENIRFSGESKYTLTDVILQNIRKLAADLGISTTQTQTQTTSQANQPVRRSRPQKAKELSNEDWENLRNFKTTKIDKKEGVDKAISDIRASLNKFSESNFEAQRDTIFALINESIGVDQETSDKVAKSLFEIASTNKFYSELYAIFYKELVDQFPFYRDFISPFIDQYKTGISQIHFVDSETDYNLFCDNNKENDKRKAESAFLTNLNKVGLLSDDVLLGILTGLEDRVFEYIDVENRTYEVDEIVENIFILATSIMKPMQTNSRSGQCVLMSLRCHLR